MCSKILSCRQFLREFHYSRLWFNYNDWKAFVYIPWLPYKWPFQIFHVIYRWFMAIYFLGWLIASGVQFSSSGPRWLIYLTNWALVGFVFYLIVAALSVTTKFISIHASKTDVDVSRTSDYQFKKPEGCCGSQTNQLSWYQMIHWASFMLFGEVALMVTILYWTLLYTPGFPVDGVNANTHLTNGIISFFDVIFFGMPISIPHIIYTVIFGATYAAFSGIYFGANGTNPVNEEPYIYPLLDYGNRPVTSSVTVVLVVLVVFPVLHLIYYSLHLIRFWAVYRIYGRSEVNCLGEEALSEEDISMEENKIIEP